jgi:ABC-type proline/glycine betaine transport system permease subunit
MWIPKTDEELRELAKAREKNAIMSGLSMALIFILIEIVDAKYIGVKIEKSPIPLTQPIYTWSQIFKSLPRLSLFGLVIWAFGYLGFRKYRPITSLICDSCSTIKRYDKIKDCDCGGHFVILDEMKWIEDEETENENDNDNKNEND